jgi:TPR repeat protein
VSVNYIRYYFFYLITLLNVILLIGTPLSSVLSSINEDEIGINDTIDEIKFGYLNNNKKGETANFDFESVLRKYKSKSKEIFNYLLNNPNIQHQSVMVGKFYNEGFGCDKCDENDNMALEWYIKASQQNDINGHYEVGYYYFCKVDYEKAFEFLQLAINNGLNRASHLVAYCYKFGYGLESDYVKAFELYKSSSEKGYIPSQYELAKCYRYSMGTQEDKNEALKWYKIYQENDGKCDVTSEINEIEKELKELVKII